MPGDEFHWPRFQATLATAARASGFVAETLCETPAGPVVAWTHPGADPAAAPAYLSAGIHGDEPAGCLAILDLLREGFFTEEPAAALPWRLCPALNPTGLARRRRPGDCGRDFNRDYRARVSTEVAAHARWLGESPTPRLFLSLHEDWEATGCYFYEIALDRSRDRAAARARAEAILAAMAVHLPVEPAALIDDHRVLAPGWIDHAPEPDEPEGWPEAIFLARLGCPLSFTFETPSRAPLAWRVAAHRAAVRTTLRTVLFGQP